MQLAFAVASLVHSPLQALLQTRHLLVPLGVQCGAARLRSCQAQLQVAALALQRLSLAPAASGREPEGEAKEVGARERQG